MRAVIVLHVSSWRRTAKSKAWGVVHLWRGGLAAAAAVVAAAATDAVLRCRSGEAAERETNRKPGVKRKGVEMSPQPTQTHLLKLLGGDALLPLWCILRGGGAWLFAFRLLVFRTCLRIQALRFVRQLCSESTSRDQGLHSAMSRADTATARPTWPTKAAALLHRTLNTCSRVASSMMMMSTNVSGVLTVSFSYLFKYFRSVFWRE